MWLSTHVDDFDPAGHWTARVTAELLTGVEHIAGPGAALTLRTQGLEQLHTVIDAVDVGRLREHVLERLRPDLLRLAVTVGRRVIGWRDEFYVDDYLILRINFPYEVARTADPSAENPGIGRVSPQVRDIARARRVIDPVYDPKAYHRGHPPAAWAHGPHRDSWTGHSRDGVNIWWAISDVPREAGMVLYTGLDDVDLPSDPRSGYLAQGYPLPAPTYTPLRPGEMLVFDPEVLHGTHLNVTQSTRVAVSMRLNAHEPTFDPACFYAREFWRRAGTIEAGRLDEVLHLTREDHLSAPVARPPVAPTARPAPIAIAVPPGARAISVGASSLVQEGGRLDVSLSTGEVVTIARLEGRVHAFDSACPHYGLSLSDGPLCGSTVHCPGCGVGFDVCTGHSPTPSLSLRLVPVAEDHGHLVLSLEHLPADTSPR